MGGISLTRRDTMLGAAAASAILIGGTQSAFAAVRLRPDINSAGGQKMAGLYAVAVKAMQDPAINYPPQPHSWIFQAYIHGVPINPFDPANSGGLSNGSAAFKKRVEEIYGNPASGTPQAAWKQAALDCWATCTHYSPYFTTWHRWYMYYFEAICREMCKDPEFQLPYWNYASNIGTSLQLPAPFRKSPSPLMFDDRGLGFANAQGTGPQNVAMNNGGYMPYPLIDYGPALEAKVIFPSDTNFFAPPSPGYTALGFTGRLECVPHDMVHDNVGGWMGNIPSAAGDPIFYVHHCQVDRLYASWEAEPGVSYNWGNSATQPSQQTWENREASFVDEKGHVVKVKLGNAVKTSSLGYGYDSLAKPPAQAFAAESFSATEVNPTLAANPPILLAALKTNSFSVGSGGASVTLQPTQPQPPAAAQSELAAPAPTHQTLVLEGLTLVRRPPAPLSVFVNLPSGATPELNSPYYAGTLNLFNFDLGTGGFMAHSEDSAAAGHEHEAAKPEAQFDVTTILRKQRAAGLWNGGPISVTVTTIGADHPGDVTYVTFDGASLLP